MTKDKIIEILEREIAANNGIFASVIDLSSAADEIEKLFEQWAPVETLPERGKTVLWQKDEFTFMIGYLGQENRFVCRPGGMSWEHLSEFVAWRPLPQAYEVNT